MQHNKNIRLTIGLQAYVITEWTNNNNAIQIYASTNVKRHKEGNFVNPKK